MVFVIPIYDGYQVSGVPPADQHSCRDAEGDQLNRKNKFHGFIALS